MDILARVFLNMDSREPNPARVAILSRRQIYVSAFANWSFVLTNLIALWQVGIEVTFAIENRVGRYSTMRCEAGSNSQFDYTAIEDRKDARHPHADRADVFVRTCAERRRASAEQFRAGQEMGMDFESNHRFICFTIHRKYTSDRGCPRLECSCTLERVARAQNCF